jgi:Holliday junction resolvase-like predicted endonuclease
MFSPVDRLINRRQQGDLGEASAIEWLTRQGATVSAPLGHSPDYDLIAEIGGGLMRVQVKTATRRVTTPDGFERWSVSVRTNGGNQSWSGTAKTFDPTKADALFVLVGDGRRWFIPAPDVEGTSALRLGGRKYSEFEIEPGASILALVYGPADGGISASRIGGPAPGERRRGRVGPDCKSGATMLSGFESLLPHSSDRASQSAKGEHQLGRTGQAIILEKRQITIPARPFTDAGLKIGDRLRFRAGGTGRVVIERIDDARPELATLLTEIRPIGESR